MASVSSVQIVVQNTIKTAEVESRSLPEFAWKDLFPGAVVELIDSPSKAVTVLSNLSMVLWWRAKVEGDAALGFDLEWKPNRKGEGFMLRSEAMVAGRLTCSDSRRIKSCGRHPAGGTTRHCHPSHRSLERFWREYGAGNRGVGKSVILVSFQESGCQHGRLVVTCRSSLTFLTMDLSVEDAKKVWRDLEISMKGCVELNSMVESVDPIGYNSVPQHPIGLARFTAMYVSRKLVKEKSIRASNWEQVLTVEQMRCECSPVLSLPLRNG